MNASPDTHGSERFTFRRADRLRHAREFQAAYRQGAKRSRWPLVIFIRPNGLGRSRLGLSVSRRVGKAVARNRIKRRLREVFRTLRPEMPAGYDIVVNVRPHEPLPLEEYRRRLRECWRAGAAASTDGLDAGNSA